ncbi:DnaA/Hda family protein [Rubripirellula amarantea]|nr:DnaA/Hda family protein [Rubripirellula amarantea]
MKEDCAQRMSAPHGCTDGKDVIGKFTDALKQRLGVDRFRMWFSHGVTFNVESCGEGNRDTLVVEVRGQFALDRLQKNFLTQLRGAAMQATGSAMDVELRLESAIPQQTELPLAMEAGGNASARTAPAIKNAPARQAPGQNPAARKPATRHSAARTSGTRSTTGRGGTASLSSLVHRADGARSRRASQESVRAAQLDQLPLLDHIESLDQQTSRSVWASAGSQPAATATPSSGAKPNARAAMTMQSFVKGSSNELAHTAASMVCQTPGVASPLFLCGPSGTGKTHLLSAIAAQLRQRHRMRRVMHMSAEQFTNDFVAALGNSGITSFRSRYRDVDALLIDDIQFLGSKKATLRELLYTIETLSHLHRPMIFSGLQSPTEIQGLTSELAGRMASGLVCPLRALDQSTRETILQRLFEERCPIAVPADFTTQLAGMIAGDGRVLGGLANNINLLQRMNNRMPTMDEVRRIAGDMLRSAQPVATLSVIETAVCEAFQLPADTLRGQKQTRNVTEPRMLAMYLARQMTSSAYAEIARHFGGKSHSTAIAAEKNVQKWITAGKSIGRGRALMSTQEAIDRVENLLRGAS